MKKPLGHVAWSGGPIGRSMNISISCWFDRSNSWTINFLVVEHSIRTVIHFYTTWYLWLSKKNTVSPLFWKNCLIGFWYLLIFVKEFDQWLSQLSGRGGQKVSKLLCWLYYEIKHLILNNTSACIAGTVITQRIFYFWEVSRKFYESK